ncbi:MAG TPA: tripartite tricarboxylate transporter TctB family protein [Burkholderiales bacterium]|nr:tripartite tricarboxylate transporter TctB family protein [Burkholderiales bacterium]
MLNFENWNVTSKRDFLLGAVLVILFLAIFFWVIPTQIPAIVAHPLAHALAPSFMPSIVTLIVAVLGFLIAVRAWRSAVTDAAAPPQEIVDGTTEDWRRAAVFRTASALVASFAYVFLLDAIGALSSAVSITVILVLLAGERRWRIVVVTGIVVPTVIYLVFTQIAAAPLPRGITSFF